MKWISCFAALLCVQSAAAGFPDALRQADHDSYWKSGVLEFSDGSTVPFSLEKTADPQMIRFAKRSVSSVKFRKLVPAGEEWCAFCEVEFWGK